MSLECVSTSKLEHLIYSIQNHSHFCGNKACTYSLSNMDANNSKDDKIIIFPNYLTTVVSYTYSLKLTHQSFHIEYICVPVLFKNLEETLQPRFLRCTPWSVLSWLWSAHCQQRRNVIGDSWFLAPNTPTNSNHSHSFQCSTMLPQLPVNPLLTPSASTNQRGLWKWIKPPTPHSK